MEVRFVNHKSLRAFLLETGKKEKPFKQCVRDGAYSGAHCSITLYH